MAPNWYPLAGVPELLRWWNGQAWEERYIPNPNLPLPFLPRYLKDGTLLSRPLQLENRASPGWYVQGSVIRWWDGSAWTELSYFKTCGVSWGGGSFGWSIAGGVISLMVTSSLWSLALASFFGGVISLAILMLILIFACFLVDTICFSNAYYIHKLKKLINSYALSFIASETKEKS